MRTDLDRRAFLKAAAALTALLWQRPRSEAKGPRKRLILLGTGGGPRPRVGSMATAQVIIAGTSAAGSSSGTT